VLRSFGESTDEVAELPAEGLSTVDDDAMHDAVTNLRSLVVAVERYRTAVAGSAGVGTTESQAISYLVTHGDRGQSELARDLGLTSSAATALVDRLERHGVAERVRHPSDRRRMIIRLTTHGEVLAERGHEPLYASLELVESGDLPTVSRWMSVIADALVTVRAEVA
jgi:DNA-binding MarR family transcriptional regulator